MCPQSESRGIVDISVRFWFLGYHRCLCQVLVPGVSWMSLSGSGSWGIIDSLSGSGSKVERGRRQSQCCGEHNGHHRGAGSGGWHRHEGLCG